ncbi:MerR family transcriptional regulator [Microbulbifer marinus]|uniref:Transcriptional regulator, MerR family n=1 Tax=Microbulbifer marinus TaxID=658218 RepID=A0A1H3VVM9_9GAMM|nr:MerR family transcriptional regulator [Microbulbifer marinus]SDZ78128.1 transcriptional regulator, MerR family [Microbulbifer marinus]
MFIGEVSRKTGLSIKAIRFYEKIGLTRTPARQGRYRVYSSMDVEVLKLIAEAKSLGVSLAKLQGVITYQNGNVDWNRIAEFLARTKSDLQAELGLLHEKIEKIDECIKSIRSCPQTVDYTL